MNWRGVLVTGGTGTFGHAFIPEMLRVGCDRVVVLSRDELKQAEMEREFDGYPGADRLRFYLGDIRDRDRLEMAMHNISHIVHAAALKRIEKCENDPIEAVSTNVQGTANVIHAALRTPTAKHMVGLSTDKACNPINLYGATKFTAERLTLAANILAAGRMKFSVVRYGNIFGSRGSVARIWQAAAARGIKKVMISEPETTRFFMRIDQAVDLVSRRLFDTDGFHDRFYWSQAMPAYRLGDLLEAMGLKAGVVTGLSPWEKQHEEIVPGVSSADARRMSIEELREELRRL
jgi:UDP-N-acetylglucosamine 4,6-dehydratase/5-epimerase